MVGEGYTAVIFQRFGADGFDIIADEGHAADLDPFGGREEGHVGGIVIQGIDKAAFFEDEVAEACGAGFEGAGDADRAAAGDNYVVIRGHFLRLQREVTTINARKMCGACAG